MRVRRPKLDFSETPAHWAINGQFAQRMSATSLWIPHLEPFLNRVLARAAKTVSDNLPSSARLQDEIRIFIRQESVHLATHSALNAALTRCGYETAAFEQHVEDEFKRLFATKSPSFLCAYCEGFETMGLPAAIAWLDEMEHLLAGSRPEVVKLWKGHLMEEFEHRTVCHDVFEAVHGGYFIRLYGFFYQLRHVSGFSNMLLRQLTERDHSSMTHAEILRSKKAARRVTRRLGWAMIRRLIPVLSPFYTPRRCPEPRMFSQYRKTIKAELA